SHSPLDAGVWHHIEFDLRHDTHRTVPAVHRGKKLGLRLRSKFKYRAVRYHELQRTYRMAHRSKAHIASMAVDRHRATDAEVRVTLHDLDGQPERVEQILKIAPTHASLHANGSFLRPQPHQAIHLTHVQMEAAANRNLPTHA